MDGCKELLQRMCGRASYSDRWQTVENCTVWVCSSFENGEGQIFLTEAFRMLHVSGPPRRWASIFLAPRPRSTDSLPNRRAWKGDIAPERSPGTTEPRARGWHTGEASRLRTPRRQVMRRCLGSVVFFTLNCNFRLMIGIHQTDPPWGACYETPLNSSRQNSQGHRNRRRRGNGHASKETRWVRQRVILARKKKIVEKKNWSN